MTPKELVELDESYQAVKAPTANNLGQKTFDQLVEDKVKKVVRKIQLYSHSHLWKQNGTSDGFVCESCNLPFSALSGKKNEPKRLKPVKPSDPPGSPIRRAI